MIIPKVGEIWSRNGYEWKIKDITLAEGDTFIFVYPIIGRKTERVFTLETFVGLFEPTLEVKLDYLLEEE